MTKFWLFPTTLLNVENISSTIKLFIEELKWKLVEREDDADVIVIAARGDISPNVLGLKVSLISELGYNEEEDLQIRKTITVAKLLGKKVITLGKASSLAYIFSGGSVTLTCGGQHSDTYHYLYTYDPTKIEWVSTPFLVKSDHRHILHNYRIIVEIDTEVIAFAFIQGKRLRIMNGLATNPYNFKPWIPPIGKNYIPSGDPEVYTINKKEACGILCFEFFPGTTNREYMKDTMRNFLKEDK